MTDTYFYIVYTAVSTRVFLRRKHFISYQTFGHRTCTYIKRYCINKPLPDDANLVYFTCILGYIVNRNPIDV